MKKYSCSQIDKLENEGIKFEDGFFLRFEQCREGWAKEKKVSIEDTVCVAERNAIERIPFFLFYEKEKVLVKFDVGIFFKTRKRKKEFHKLRQHINQCGYSSFDLT